MMESIKRGDIWSVDLNPTRGSEQGKIRPCIIIQNDIGNKFSPTTIVIPLTSKIPERRYPTDVLIPKKFGLAVDSVALTNQIRTIDKSRLVKKHGELDNLTLKKVEIALQISLGLVDLAAKP